MFKWKDEFSVNIVEIDNQHKKLFEIGSRINEIASLNDDYDHYDEIIAILDELREYTIYHFDFEEKLLQQYGYIEFESQHFEHQFFIKKLERIGRRNIDDNQNETASDIYKFVIDWISDHILKRDMKYKDFMNSKGLL